MDADRASSPAGRRPTAPPSPGRRSPSRVPPATSPLTPSGGSGVRVSGSSVTGGTDERVRRVPLPPSAPVLHVRASAIDVSSRDAEGREPSRRELREQRRELGR